MSDVTCLDCMRNGLPGCIGHEPHFSYYRPGRKKRLGEKVGDFIEEMIDTLVDFASDILEGFDVRNR